MYNQADAGNACTTDKTLITLSSLNELFGELFLNFSPFSDDLLKVMSVYFTRLHFFSK